MTDSVLTHGVTSRLKAADEIDERLAELAVNGYTILDGKVGEARLQQMSARLDDIYADQCAELGGEQALQQIQDTDVARCVLAYDRIFLELATNPQLMELLRRLFGSEFVLTQQNGLLNRPDRQNYQVKWHRDLSYQHWTSTRPIAINALFCVDTFTSDNGATFVLPGTHHVAEFPTDGFVTRFEKQLVAPRGSFLVLDAMLFHRAGINRSQGVRRAVNHLIGLPFMAQQIDIARAMAAVGKVTVEDESVRRYLGYRWSPAQDVVDWRTRRMPKPVSR